MFKCLFLVFAFVNPIISDTVVWDHYLDYCFVKIPPDSRTRARCEDLTNVKIERHYLQDFYFWCIIVNNTENRYKELVVETNEPRIYNDTVMNINYLKTVEFDTIKENYDSSIIVDFPKGYKFAYELSRGYFALGLLLENNVTKVYRVDRIVSLKLDGMESCNASRSDEPDVLTPLREPPGNIPNRFLKHCMKLNLNRAEPESGFCENVDEVIVRRLVLNKIMPFWCVTVNPKTNADIKIKMDGTNNWLEYYNGTDTIFINSAFGIYHLSTTRQIVIAIQPRILVLPVLNITSLRINDNESCGIVLEQSMCGEPQYRVRSLIANGELVQPGQYPWHTAILQKQYVPNPPKYICGGTIIGKNVILTAGHCVSNIDGTTEANKLLIEVGLNDLINSTIFTQTVEVSKVILHEEFDINYLEHDIAILKLVKFLEYNSLVHPICIAENSGQLNDITGIVPGWGRNEKQQRQHLLSAASMPMVNGTVCRQSNRNFFQQFLNDWKFCAGYRNGTSVCTGDSGGGFAVKYPRRWYLRGIVSLGVTERGLCALEEYVIFTDVAQYFKWIKSKLNL